MYRVLLEIRFYVSISFLLLFVKEIVAKIAPDIAPIKVVKIALHAANDIITIPLYIVTSNVSPCFKSPTANSSIKSAL